ncbi:MAG TPA: SufS family cysteine desulfurase [Thermoanaerobaculaceae bacterium]|nr:SufS family cysteine desulfurase [Thermoanaerobaculaceae bacterium]HRS14686.1 SufS family cysteine desulfurase [Thermoanaerobaculaceae bacterium]
MAEGCTGVQAGTGAGAGGFDARALRERFPILGRMVNGHRLVYLDNAATTQKPAAVLEALERFYRLSNANVHRGVHTLAEEATSAYEACRRRVARFVGAADPRQVVITRNATEALNLVARGWGSRLGPGDEVLVTEMEHHSNLVPWIMLARERGVTLRHVPVTESGELDLAACGRLLGPRTRIVAVAAMSNVLGTINPLSEIAEMARRVGAVVVVDGAQAVPHLPLDLAATGADFLAFSAHKAYGPTGVGFLVGGLERLEEVEPVWGGGEMIREVHLDRATWNDLPHRLEAGTPNIADAAAFPAALDVLEELGMDEVRAHERALVTYTLERLASLGALRIHGPLDPERRGGLVSFSDPDIHPHDLAQVLDSLGIAVRAGHHCAQPLMRRLGEPATVRASFGVYNDRDDVDALVDGLRAARRYFGS